MVTEEQVREGIKRGLNRAAQELIKQNAGKVHEVLSTRLQLSKGGSARITYAVKVILQADAGEQSVKVDAEDDWTRLRDKGHVDAGIIYADGALLDECPECEGNGKDVDDNPCPECEGSGMVKAEASE